MKIQMIKQRSTAFKLVDTGAFPLTLLKILIKTKNMVTSTPIRPGTTSGLMIKDTQETRRIFVVSYVQAKDELRKPRKLR